jgi:sugar phosphate isomerase/epimerase
MLNRRQFVAAGLGAAFAAPAAPGDRMRFAMSAHQFRRLSPHPELGIQITSRYGFHGLEPFQDDLPQYLKKPPEALKALLEAANISLVTVAGGGDYLNPERIPQTLENNLALCRYISHFGCHHLKVNLSRRAGDGTALLSDDNARALAKTLNEFGRRTQELGIKFAFHPHTWTLVEREPELHKIMDLTDPKLVYIVADTCHLTLGGIDPVKCLRDYYPRVAAVHLKDAEPKYSTARGWKGPAPSQQEHERVNLYKRFGAGGVDFQGFFRVLREKQYDGWVTLDFDAPRPGDPSVEENMAYFKKYLVEQLNVTNLRS